jgi:hypothetical protein
MWGDIPAEGWRIHLPVSNALTPCEVRAFFIG